MFVAKIQLKHDKYMLHVYINVYKHLRWLEVCLVASALSIGY